MPIIKQRDLALKLFLSSSQTIRMSSGWLQNQKHDVQATYLRIFNLFSKLSLILSVLWKDIKPKQTQMNEMLFFQISVTQGLDSADEILWDILVLAPYR